MVATLLLFAAADISLPSVNWGLFFGPLAPIAFAVAMHRDDGGRIVATRMRGSAVFLMVAPPIVALGSLALEAAVPSIIWFISGVSAAASLLGAISFLDVDSSGEDDTRGYACLS
jgi:hypothetical protein